MVERKLDVAMLQTASDQIRLNVGGFLFSVTWCRNSRPKVTAMKIRTIPLKAADLQSGGISQVEYASVKGYDDGYRAGVSNVLRGQRIFCGNKVGTGDTYPDAWGEGYREGQLDAVFSRGLGILLVHEDDLDRIGKGGWADQSSRMRSIKSWQPDLKGSHCSLGDYLHVLLRYPQP